MEDDCVTVPHLNQCRCPLVDFDNLLSRSLDCGHLVGYRSDILGTSLLAHTNTNRLYVDRTAYFWTIRQSNVRYHLRLECQMAQPQEQWHI